MRSPFLVAGPAPEWASAFDEHRIDSRLADLGNQTEGLLARATRGGINKEHPIATYTSAANIKRK